MSEEPNEIELDVDPQQEKVNPDQDLKANFLNFHKSLWHFIKETSNISEGTDYIATTEGIKKDIEFKGHGVWILVISIFIASIGLNVNSTAVIIGAMLISPLMGPIMGVGLSLGTNDWPTLIRSIKSFGTMTLLAMLTSAFYFFITPLSEVQPELIARTRPTILDVFIAICGGMAGIIAGSRKEKSNVIPGVAIATALMPPLCTAGYGLANGNWEFFFGAFYLFFLNSLFITITTVLIVRFLRFPIVHFVDSVTEKKVKRYMVLFVLIVIIPSGWIFWGVIKESIFHQKAETYIEENFQFPETSVDGKRIVFSDTLATIEISLNGKLISQNQKDDLYRMLATYDLNSTLFIENTVDRVRLKIYQSNDNSQEIAELRKEIADTKFENVEDQLQKNIETIEDRNRKIRYLRRKIIKLKGDSIPLQQIEKEVLLQYEGVARLSYGTSISINQNTNGLDTIPCLMLNWKSEVKNADEQQQKLPKWLQIRLGLDTLQVIRY
ncbi:MAG: DUF389 domain-containing protein [Flavobacteriales bacterium]|nr:DUF389 domain-containing protein [Flavobacteriales bacterium]